MGSLALFCVWWRWLPADAFVAAEAGPPGTAEYLASYLCLLVLTGVLPLAVLGLRFRVPPEELGVGLGDGAFGLRCLAVAVPLAIVVLLPASLDPGLRATYPLIDLRGAGVSGWLLWEMTALVYYAAWELYFRGVLLFGLRDSLGAAGAMAFQVAVSALAHADKPMPELLAAIPAGVLFGVVALRTRSVLYVVLIHWAIGAVMDVCAAFEPLG